MSYKTPGVYVEEKSLFPPSVAQVETAIPAFIGYTEKAEDEEGDSLHETPTRIESMLEYETYFGGPQPQAFEVTLADETPYLPQSVNFDGDKTPYLMHPALEMFFANGGGACYIVSVGDYDDETEVSSLDSIEDYDELKDGLDKIRKVDEVTLVVIPEASQLSTDSQYDLYKDVLMQCGDLQDRFGIFDVRSEDDDGSDFRNGIGTSFLRYGAAYYPHLNTSISYAYTPAAVTFSHGASEAFDGLTLDNVETLSTVLNYEEQLDEAKTKVEEAEADAQPTSVNKSERLHLLNIAISKTRKAKTFAEDALELVEDDSFTAADSEIESANTHLENVESENLSSSDTNEDIKDALAELVTAVEDARTAMDSILTQINTETGINSSHNDTIGEFFTNEFQSNLTNLLDEERITMPPSSTMAGIYAKVDEDRGVWKSPANVSINRVSGPSEKLTISENDSFNVHPTGKSINVIRAFTGKGTLVWGARTLDGNSNEWRYISVRRFFNMVEESVKKATEPFVFEPNNANTWVKVKAMIENFLTVQWRSGALMGAKPDDAFYVKVGLGETMTQQHVLDGEMIVEIGMAVVRPAEFIILRFSHKMLES